MDKKNIYQTITAVMEEIDPIGKNAYNQQQKFNYRGIDDVMNALNPAFVKHHLFMVPEVMEQRREERGTKSGGNIIYSICKVKYTFYAEDGSKLETIVVGEGMDSGDKASNKALAAAFKYACFQVFCIPTEEIKDPDADSHETASKSAEIITADEAEKFISECNRIGKTKEAILKCLKVPSLEGMTKAEFDIAMKNFALTPDKSNKHVVPENIPPDNTGSELPWTPPQR